MDLSLALSVLAVSISLVSLLSQLVRSRWERPVVVVTGEVVAHGSRLELPSGAVEEQAPFWEFTLVAANVGERAVTITKLSWRRGAGRYSMLVAHESQSAFRLEPHDSHTWTLTRETSMYWLLGADVYPCAAIVKRPKFFGLIGRSGLAVVKGTTRRLPDPLPERDPKWQVERPRREPA